MHIGYDQADALAPEQLQRAGAIDGRQCGKPCRTKRIDQCLAQCGIVLDYQKRVVHCAHCLSSAGSSMTKLAPRAASARHTLPPCASTTDLTMDSPMPLPRARVVKKGSKIRSRICAGTPGPLSLTTICARPVGLRRASNSKLSGAVAARSALVARFETADISEGALA